MDKTIGQAAYARHAPFTEDETDPWDDLEDFAKEAWEGIGRAAVTQFLEREKDMSKTVGQEELVSMRFTEYLELTTSAKKAESELARLKTALGDMWKLLEDATTELAKYKAILGEQK